MSLPFPPMRSLIAGVNLNRISRQTSAVLAATFATGPIDYNLLGTQRWSGPWFSRPSPSLTILLEPLDPLRRYAKLTLTPASIHRAITQASL